MKVWGHKIGISGVCTDAWPLGIGGYQTVQKVGF